LEGIGNENAYGRRRGGKSTLTSVTIDSYEAGHQNWTKGFENEFKKMSGYDIRYYLPAIAGRVVGSTDETERFLWDFRKTVSDLIVKNYYERFQTLAHENNISFAAEGYGNFGNTDDFSTNKFIDVPATEFWAFRRTIMEASPSSDPPRHIPMEEKLLAQKLLRELPKGYLKPIRAISRHRVTGFIPKESTSSGCMDTPTARSNRLPD
jgi:hypothetical protein